MDLTCLPGIGKDKWIKYHYGGDPKRVEPKSNLELILSSKIKKEISFDEARAEVAVDIYNFANGRDIYVGMSGGADSEIVAQSFYEQGIPFTPLITDLYYYNIHSNYADTWWAKKWCQEHNVTPCILKYSVTKLLIENTQLGEKINARHLYPLHYLSLADYAKQQGGVFVSGQGLIEYFPDINLDYLHYFQDSNMKDENGNKRTGWLFHECDSYLDVYDPGYHPYNFLSWTPEIMHSIVSVRSKYSDGEVFKHKLYRTLPRPKMQGPDVVIHMIGEQQRFLRSTFGTSEIAYLGTTQTIINSLK